MAVTDYAAFLASKAYTPPASNVEPQECHPSLFPFQQALVRWAVTRGRAAIFADCGMGKTRMQVEWARQVGGPALIIAPLGVTDQTIAEARQIGVSIGRLGEGKPISITNYERLHQTNPRDWRAVVCDESSILKSVDGKTRTKLLTDWTAVPYRLCCTATPAPNDIAELANHAEFLGVMSRPEMLATFFVHDERSWRLKGHADRAFWQWLSTWAVYVRRPSDIGFEDTGFVLPQLTIRDAVVPVDVAPDGVLFPTMTGGVAGRTVARRQSLDGRVAKAAALLANDEQWLVWCGLNAEQDAIVAALGDQCVSIDGQTQEHERISRELAWREGRARVLVTKPSVFGYGMNWQHCHRMLFLGIGDSYEQYYQSIRRCWRFGQTSPVDVTIVTSDAEGAVVSNVRRKEHESEETAARVVAEMREFETAAVAGTQRQSDEYRQRVQMELPGWLKGLPS